MTSLNQLATRLRLNAASMEHGDAEADIRAAADILDSFADTGELEDSGCRKFDGCPLAAIGYMMDIHAAIRKILKNSRKELEKERNKKENEK